MQTFFYLLQFVNQFLPDSKEFVSAHFQMVWHPRTSSLTSNKVFA